MGGGGGPGGGGALIFLYLFVCSVYVCDVQCIGRRERQLTQERDTIDMTENNIAIFVSQSSIIHSV